MISNYCLCQQKKPVLFIKYIEYKNETVFKDYEGIIIGRCQNCGLLKTVVKKNFYPEKSRGIFYEENRRLFEGLFKPVVDKVTKYKKTGRLLDIGCSSGILLELFKQKGFDVYGIEPNKQAYISASKKFQGKIFNGFLSEFIKNNKKKFDVVVYNHVLEHIDDVNEELELARFIISKNGLLVIGVPNVDNLIFYLRKKYWESLMPREHVWHFSKKYICNLLKKRGFKVCNTSLSDDLRPNYPLSKRIYFRFLSLLNKFIGTGESVLIIAST